MEQAGGFIRRNSGSVVGLLFVAIILGSLWAHWKIEDAAQTRFEKRPPSYAIESIYANGRGATMLVERETGRMWVFFPSNEGGQWQPIASPIEKRALGR